MSEDVFEIPKGTEYRYLVQEKGDKVQYVHRRHYISPCLSLTRRCILPICLGMLSLVTVAGYLAYGRDVLFYLLQFRPPRPNPNPHVHTDCGDFEGREINGSYSFKGIPYAAPPTDQRRWLATLKPWCGNGVGGATRFRGMCRQVHPLSDTGKIIGGESCLFVNVWTPTLSPDAGLPVMVWIRGGYHHMVSHRLSGGEEDYSPTEELANRTGMVYVTFNYRLNVFGFMALELLREESPTNTSGNYGFMDQIAALQWVQRNIQAFGGDPSKVTIVGQSSVWTLMMSPLAKGLFRAAVDMSGSYVHNSSLEKAEEDNLGFLNKTGCTDLACLRKLTTTQILRAVPWKEYPSWGADDLVDLPTKGRFLGPIALVDGHVLQAPPFETWENGGFFNDVPFLIGTTEQETDFLPPYENISTWTWEDYQWFVKEKLSPFGEGLPKEALDLYPSSAPCPTHDRCPERAYTTMVSDMRVTCPNNDLARRAAAALISPVYRYVVTHTPSRAVNFSGSFPSRFSFHGLDSFAFFGGLEKLLGGALSDEDRAFQDLITENLVYFAKEGKMPEQWPEYPASTALLSDNLSVVHDYSAERCQLWEKNGFYPYAWVN